MITNAQSFLVFVAHLLRLLVHLQSTKKKLFCFCFIFVLFSLCCGIFAVFPLITVFMFAACLCGYDSKPSTTLFSVFEFLMMMQNTSIRTRNAREEKQTSNEIIRQAIRIREHEFSAVVDEFIIMFLVERVRRSASARPTQPNVLC